MAARTPSVIMIDNRAASACQSTSFSERHLLTKFTASFAPIAIVHDPIIRICKDKIATR